jgi:hypothetical protein
VTLELPPKPRREPTKQPPLLLADIPIELLPLDDSALLNDIRKAAATRKKGDPSFSLIVTVCWHICHLMRTGRRESYIEIGNDCGCCDESVRQVLLFIKPHGIIGWLHVMDRVGRNFWRLANHYSAPFYIKTEGVRMARRVAERVAAFHHECAKRMGLHFRATTGGMNTTPMKPQPGFT